MCVSVLLDFRMNTGYTPGARGGQNRVSDPQELQWWIVVSYRWLTW